MANSSLDSLWGSITGQSKVELSQQALDIQQQIAKDTISAEIEAQKLKYNPELSKQRTIQVAIIVVPIVIALSLIVYIKYFR